MSKVEAVGEKERLPQQNGTIDCKAMATVGEDG